MIFYYNKLVRDNIIGNIEISFEEVKQAMQKKKDSNGAFDNRIFLISVDEKR